MPIRCDFFAFNGESKENITKLILRDGKFVGALTHVMVVDSKTGYGIYSEDMLETANNVGNDLRAVPQKRAS